MGSTLKILITCHLICILILSPSSLTVKSEEESSLCINKVLPKNNSLIYCPGKEMKKANASIELIGILFDDEDKWITSGAIPYSIENVNRNPELMPDDRVLCYTAGYASRNHETFAPMRLMSDMKDEGVKYFVGLDQSCAQEAALAAAWDFPLLSYKCADTKVSNTNYPTFARTLPPSSKISRSLISTLKHFNWYKVVVIAGNTTKYLQIKEAFIQGTSNVNEAHKKANDAEARQGASVNSNSQGSESSIDHSSSLEYDRSSDSEIMFTGPFSMKLVRKLKRPKYRQFEITESQLVPADYIETYKEKIEKVVEDSKEKTRIYVVIAEVSVAIDLARILHEKKKNFPDSPDHFIVSIDLDQHSIVGGLQEHCIKFFETASNESDAACDGSLFVVMPSQMNISETFVKTVKNYSFSSFDVPEAPAEIGDVGVPNYAAYAYDAVQVLAQGLTQAYKSLPPDMINGTTVFNGILGQRYTSIGGFEQQIDEFGDADGNFTLLSFSKERGMHRTASFLSQECSEKSPDCLPVIPEFQFLPGQSIEWPNGQVPPDEPECGFNSEYCEELFNWKQIILVTCCFSLTSIALGFIVKHYRYEKKLACLLWKVDVKDIILPRTSSEYTLNNLRSTVNFQGIDLARIASYRPTAKYGPLNFDLEQGPVCSGVGFYKGNVVYVKRIYKQGIDLTREIRKELIQVREMRHENINPFIGASVDSSNICLLTLYCARGSLEDILENTELDLDPMFIASLVADLIKGMIYLHDSEIVSHGNLRSSNCLVDSRWVLQIADFGLHEFKSNQDLPKEQREKQKRRLLCRAPELLRQVNPPARGTQKGDVYSFAILLYEIHGRRGPWGKAEVSQTLESLLDRIANPGDYGVISRPSLEHISSCASYIIKCMEDCWHEDPEARPDFRFINLKLKDMQSGLKPNIFDNMLAMMEKYAYTLETRVKERTNELSSEKKKTEMLLLRMLPKSVADQLKIRGTVDPESFDCVTIYFSDIVGFTEIASQSTPMEVVDLLNDLYTCFDGIIGNYDVYKVETSGDAYMVVSGLPQRNGNQHAGQIANMALHLLSEIQHFEIRHRENERLKLRIGIHSGPCVAGVVGLKMPRYCLFGDSVNTASRMESSGEAFKIHVSDDTKVILDELGGYILKMRGNGRTVIKGKGVMKTHWLIGKTQETSKYEAKIQNKSPIGSSNGCLDGSIIATRPIGDSTSSSSTSISNSHPSNSLRLNFSHSYEHNEFPTHMKLNNLGTSCNVPKSQNTSAPAANHFDVLTGDVNENQNSHSIVSPPAKKHDSCLFLHKEPSQKFVPSSVRSGLV